MDLAIKELKSRIACYDFWVRDCSPYFKEPKEKYKLRLKELTDMLYQLRRVLGIVTNENAVLPIHGVISWALYPENKTPHDGKYLCYVKQQQECGNIWEYQKVVDNSMNEWILEENEVVVAWSHLPNSPCL